MGKRINAGNRYGILTTVRKAPTQTCRRQWLCRCDCGNESVVHGGNLTSDHTTSCGCQKARLISEKNSTHRRCRTKLYGIYRAMIDRCENPKVACFSRYGGRGIKVCKRWRHSFEAFLEDMGERPSPLHSLDRKENSGDYCPENCRWATGREQGQNKRNNVFVEYKGERHTISEWARRQGLTTAALSSRLRRQGMSLEEAMTRPLQSSSITVPN